MENKKLLLVPKNIYFRILVVGDSNVGKTTFLEKIAKKTDPLYRKKNLFFYELNEFHKFYHYECHGVLVFLDISQKNGLTKAMDWVKKIVKEIPYDIPILIVINKIDLQNTTSIDKIEDTYLEYPTVEGWVACSAMKNKNTEEVVSRIQQIIKYTIHQNIYKREEDDEFCFGF